MGSEDEKKGKEKEDRRRCIRNTFICERVSCLGKCYGEVLEMGRRTNVLQVCSSSFAHRRNTPIKSSKE